LLDSKKKQKSVSETNFFNRKKEKMNQDFRNGQAPAPVPEKKVTFLDAIRDFFGGLSGENVKSVHLTSRPVQAMAKDSLGSMAFARADGVDVTIEFSTEAQNTLAEDQGIAEIQAEVQKELSEAQQGGEDV